MATHPKAVIIGAGIVGCALSDELTARGWTDVTVYEAGLGFAVRKNKRHFTGQAALEKVSEETVTRRLTPLVIQDRHAVVMGKEPVYAAGQPVGYVTSAAYGYTIGALIAYAWLPAEHTAPGTAVEIEYFGAKVLALTATEPLFDRICPASGADQALPSSTLAVYASDLRR
jgi:glycine cleavage system aminomethyltransferase T